jgi:hypothetical protein
VNFKNPNLVPIANQTGDLCIDLSLSFVEELTFGVKKCDA